jgi:hypothetical protein
MLLSLADGDDVFKKLGIVEIKCYIPIIIRINIQHHFISTLF